MKLLAGGVLGALASAAFAISTASAQTYAPTPNPDANQAAQLQELTKKIEEQNAKIDMLSQQILKLQLEISHQRPGVMIGEASASPAGSTIATSTSSPAGLTSASVSTND